MKCGLGAFAVFGDFDHAGGRADAPLRCGDLPGAGAEIRLVAGRESRDRAFSLRYDLCVADGVGRRVIPHLDGHGLVAVRDEHGGDDARSYRGAGDCRRYAARQNERGAGGGAERERTTEVDGHPASVPRFTADISTK
jgi:hypothetical protein